MYQRKPLRRHVSGRRARFDILARGLWSLLEMAFFDVSVLHPGAKSYAKHKTLAKLCGQHERSAKMYGQYERSKERKY